MSATVKKKKTMIGTNKPRSTSGDWPEDAILENGNYFNGCYFCGAQFIGHKRRVVCKICDDRFAAGELCGATGDYRGLMGHPQAALLAQKDAEIMDLKNRVGLAEAGGIEYAVLRAQADRADMAESSLAAEKKLRERTEAERDQLLRAINWACGCGAQEFRMRDRGEGAFWWRLRLTSIAGLQYDREQLCYVIPDEAKS